KLNDLDSTKLIKISDMRNFPNILSTQINSANRYICNFEFSKQREVHLLQTFNYLYYVHQLFGFSQIQGNRPDVSGVAAQLYRHRRICRLLLRRRAGSVSNHVSTDRGTHTGLFYQRRK
ncbi:MAG: hypothetical protein SOY65_04895, partial [Marinifilaceae bacterium]|nr:hypothetical protein [Marinifilaceae bacterium]